MVGFLSYRFVSRVSVGPVEAGVLLVLQAAPQLLHLLLQILHLHLVSRLDLPQPLLDDVCVQRQPVVIEVAAGRLLGADGGPAQQGVAPAVLGAVPTWMQDQGVAAR